MRVLAVTNMYPVPQAPTLGIFIEQQIISLREIGLEVEVLFLDRVHKGMKVYYQTGPQLGVKIRKFDPDLVHVMYGGVMANVVTRNVKDRPTVVTFHGSDLLGEPLNGWVRKALGLYGVWTSWSAARRATGVVVVSNKLRELLPKEVDQSKVRVIPCGIDIELFKLLDHKKCQRELGWAENHFHILFVSNNNDQVKRPELALAAYDAIRRHGVNAEFHYLHGVSYREVPVWLNASDVLVLTSRHEGSPTIIKEALATKLPIVSVDVGDIRERVAGVDGCHLALADPSDLCEKLLRVYSAKQRINGPTRIEQFSCESIAFSLKQFYKEVSECWQTAISKTAATDFFR